MLLQKQNLVYLVMWLKTLMDSGITLTDNKIKDVIKVIKSLEK